MEAVEIAAVKYEDSVVLKMGLLVLIVFHTPLIIYILLRQ